MAKRWSGRRKADRAVVRELPETLDLLAVCLEAGAPMTNAIATVAAVSQPATAAILHGIDAQLQVGRDPQDAWGSLADHPDWGPPNVVEISEVGKDDLGFAGNSGFASPDGLADLDEFPMADGWKPADETAFDAKLRRSQIPCLADSRVADALAEFSSYWQAAGKVLTQAMWEHKFFQLLARQKAQGAFAVKPKDPSHRRLNQPQQGGNGAGTP